MANSESNAKDAADNTVGAEVEQNPTRNQPDGGDGAGAANLPGAPGPTITNLSQVDVDLDLDLARSLQEQERVYATLEMRAGGGIHYGGQGYGRYRHAYEVHDDAGYAAAEDYEAEDAFDVQDHGEGIGDGNQQEELDPASFSSDEAYARALQDAEEREMVARVLAESGMSGIGGEEVEDGEVVDENGREHGGNYPDPWEEYDPDELTYEELLELGEVIGTHCRGLSADAIASLPSKTYKSQDTEQSKSDACAICISDYEKGNKLTVLSCKHSFHPECVSRWLEIKKVCPVCNMEVSTPAGKS